MKILLHICCGPCAIYCVNSLREKGHSVSGFFYNPNIHPVAEYDKRKQAVVNVSKRLEFPLHFLQLDVGATVMAPLKGSINRTPTNEEDNRCQPCWHLRLKHTAEFAKTKNYDAFTTTLLISPYQDHNKLKDIANCVAKDSGINFYYEDFRPGFRESHNLSKQMGLYHQKYCGCIYSEQERCERIIGQGLKSKHQSSKSQTNPKSEIPTTKH